MSGARTREVLDSDLDALANGTAEASTALALWPACLSLSIGLVFGLTTVEKPSPQLVAGYVAVIAITFIFGVYFLILWTRKRGGNQQILQKIRNMSPFQNLEGSIEVTESETTPDDPPRPS